MTHVEYKIISKYQDKSTYQGYTGQQFIRKKEEMLKGRHMLKDVISDIVCENICSVHCTTDASFCS